MESITLKKFIEDRIEENKNLFTTEELQYIKNNNECFNKVYLLGAINGKDCYKSYHE